MSHHADVVLVGGGLANGLIAWRLRQLRPGVRVLVLEAGATLGGNHTWSFHAGDLTPAQQAWLAPVVGHRWSSHSVRFPGGTRRLAGGYATIPSQRFHDVLASALGPTVRLNTAAAIVEAQRVLLRDGTELRAPAVIDGRGRAPAEHIRLGWQKFIGREFRLVAPHGLSGPVLMDATVPQHDGFRFVYTLPLDARRVLVEDTYYADGPRLEPDQIRARIDTYVRAQGWEAQEMLREEHGVLPIVLDGDPQALWGGDVPRSGLGAALFHPTTGYSLPDAVRLADLVASLPDLSAAAVHAAIRAHALAQWRGQAFFRVLNRMLFQAAAPQQRWRVMQRFYGLPEPLVARFYAGRPTWADKLRIVSGRPPVPLAAALQAALGRVPPRRSFT